MFGETEFTLLTRTLFKQNPPLDPYSIFVFRISCSPPPSQLTFWNSTTARHCLFNSHQSKHFPFPSRTLCSVLFWFSWRTFKSRHRTSTTASNSHFLSTHLFNPLLLILRFIHQNLFIFKRLQQKRMLDKCRRMTRAKEKRDACIVLGRAGVEGRKWLGSRRPHCYPLGISSYQLNRYGVKLSGALACIFAAAAALISRYRGNLAYHLENWWERWVRLMWSFYSRFSRNIFWYSVKTY